MSEGEDDAQKTEEPTQKRLDDSRKKGQLPTSKEINHFAILLVFTLIITVLAPQMLSSAKIALLPFITSPHDIRIENVGSFHRIIGHTIKEAAMIMAVPVVLAVIFALASGFLQTQFNVSLDPIKPKWEKISPLKGIKRMFSMKSLVEFLKSLLKLIIVGSIGAIAIWPNLDKIRLLPSTSIQGLLDFTAELASKMLIWMLSIIFLIAVVDYMYQRFEFLKNLRMSKQDIKDEHKQQEGDPMVKQKLRAIRMERAQKRMMANVPDSDVVITNPTHYAIALKYDSLTMDAPVVIAMGKDKVAFRIRDLAEKHKITIVRNPPLARALFADATIDVEIPLEHYQAAAEVISYVYKLQGRENI